MRRRQLLLAGIAMPGAPLQAAPSPPAGPPIDWPPIELVDGRTLGPGSRQDQPAVVVFWAWPSTPTRTRCAAT